MSSTTISEDETPYSSAESAGQVSEGPWTLARLSTEKTLPKNFVLGEALSDSWTVDYDPFEPAEEDTRDYGILVATRRARINALSNAAKAISKGSRDGPSEWYRNAVLKACSEIELENAILDWDIHHSEKSVREMFAINLLLLSMMIFDQYDTPSALDVLKRDHKNWLQLFQIGHIDMSEKKTFSEIQEKEEWQTITLFRSILEFSGGKVDCKQHVFEPNYTVSQNTSLCARRLEVACSCQLGSFDPEKMHAALSDSKLFSEVRGPDIQNMLEQRLRLMRIVPVGIPDNHLDLPLQILNEVGAGQINFINIHFEYMCNQFPSFQSLDKNILLLLTWTSTYHEQTFKVLSNWVKSEESLDLYHRLIKGLSLQQTEWGFALTLAALLCRERLLSCNTEDNERIIVAHFLIDFDAIMNDQPISDKWTIFEQMIISLMRVLSTFEDSGNSQKIFGFLAEVLDKAPEPLKSLDGVADQYCIRKLRGHEHNIAFEEVIEELGTFMKAIFPDSGWIMIA